MSIHEFERHGWQVEAVYLDHPMRHDEDVSAHQPRLRWQTTSHAILLPLQQPRPYPAIQSAGVSRGRNGFRKDKAGEKLTESEDDLLEHRTVGSDAFDTLYIGSENFPVRDIMRVPVSGIF